MDISGMPFAILHITIPSYTLFKPYPGWSKPAQSEKSYITVHYFALTLFFWLRIRIVWASICIVTMIYIHIVLPENVCAYKHFYIIVLLNNKLSASKNMFKVRKVNIPVIISCSIIVIFVFEPIFASMNEWPNKCTKLKITKQSSTLYLFFTILHLYFLHTTLKYIFTLDIISTILNQNKLFIG